MADMRRCKECGKLFQPKGREQYCSDIHYRPCPICGEPVEAKYLSDPPRRCANCKANKLTQRIKPLFNIPDIQSPDIIEPTSKANVAQPSKSSNEKSVSNPTRQLNTEELSTKDIRKFIGKDYRKKRGFLPNHVYELSIGREEYSYCITALYDYTANKQVDIVELFSSVTSIEQHFTKLSKLK